MEYCAQNNPPVNTEQNLLLGDGETVLIVDDEAAFADVTKLLLELSGYTVLTAGDGIEGVSLFLENKERIKIILCDLNMPKLGGRSILQKFLEISPEVKILIISGSIEEDYLVHYLIPNKIEFLQKPFLTEKLLRCLKQLLISPKSTVSR